LLSLGVLLFTFIFVEFACLPGLFSKAKIFAYSVEAAQISSMSVKDLKSLIDSESNDFNIIDVRTPQEYQVSRISDAINIPLADITKGRGISQIKLLSTNQKIILYCSAGVRSAKALRILNQAEISAINLQGGIRQWKTQIEPQLPIYK
jgi:adenylyltransferase/sulfurtransferase